jgi:hypothetical protein
LQKCFSRGQGVPADASVPRNVQDTCFILFEWINNTAARASHFKIAEYIHACYARNRLIPPIPVMLAPFFNQSTSIKTKALEYYFDVWKDLTMSKDLKRSLFLLTCRGHCLRFNNKLGVFLKGNSLHSEDLQDTDYNRNTWSELENCANIFEMFYAYSAYIHSSYVVRVRSEKRPKIAASTGQASSHLRKRDLFFQFHTWVEEMHARFAFYIIDDETKKNGRIARFFHTLLWHIVLDTPMQDRLRDAAEPGAIEIVPLLDVPK